MRRAISLRGKSSKNTVREPSSSVNEGIFSALSICKKDGDFFDFPRSSPERSFKKVDFPLPFAPQTQIKSPGLTSRDAFFKTCFVP